MVDKTVPHNLMVQPLMSFDVAILISFLLEHPILNGNSTLSFNKNIEKCHKYLYLIEQSTRFFIIQYVFIHVFHFDFRIFKILKVGFIFFLLNFECIQMFFLFFFFFFFMDYPL